MEKQFSTVVDIWIPEWLWVIKTLICFVTNWRASYEKRDRDLWRVGTPEVFFGFQHCRPFKYLSLLRRMNPGCKVTSSPAYPVRGQCVEFGGEGGTSPFFCSEIKGEEQYWTWPSATGWRGSGGIPAPMVGNLPSIRERPMRVRRSRPLLLLGAPTRCRMVSSNVKKGPFMSADDLWGVAPMVVPAIQRFKRCPKCWLGAHMNEDLLFL